MDESLAELLNRAMEDKGLSRKGLARAAGTGYTNLGHLLTGERINPSRTIADRLAQALGVPPGAIERAIRESHRRARAGLQQRRGQGVRRPTHYAVPLLGHIPGGQPLPPAEQSLDLVEVPEDVERHHPDYAVIVEGDSMVAEAGESYEPGEIVFVRKQELADDGDIVIAAVTEPEFSVTLKRLRRGPGYAILEPGSLRYEPLRPRDVRVLGKVVGKRSRKA